MARAPITYCTFATLRGKAAAAFAGDALVRFELPDPTDADASLAKLRLLLPDAIERAPMVGQRRIIDAVVKYLDGRTKTISPELPIVLDGISPFTRRVYEALRQVPSGKTVSYGELAELAGNPGAARAVGTAMKHNPFWLVVPCHRVIQSGNKLGPYGAPGGEVLKRHLLEYEGAFGKPTVDGAIKSLQRRGDRALAKLIKEAPRCELAPEAGFDLFESLSRTIVYQQLSGKAAATIYGRVAALLPKARSKRAAAVAQLTDAQLRGAGLSGQKTLALRDLATKQLEGALPTTAELALLDDETVITRLTAVRGIGRWSAEMLLMFRLGRLDVMPSTDLGVQKGHALTYQRQTPLTAKQLHAFGERWRPFRSVASWYMWRATELYGNRAD